MGAPVREAEDDPRGKQKHVQGRTQRPGREQNSNETSNPRETSPKDVAKGVVAAQSNEPASHEPPWRRKPQPGGFAGDGAAEELHDGLRPCDDIPEPPWRRRPRSGAFAGDVEVAELRDRLRLCEDVPEPPLPPTGGIVPSWLGRLTRIAVVAAVVGVLAYNWGANSPPQVAALDSHDADPPPQRTAPAQHSARTTALPTVLVPPLAPAASPAAFDALPSPAVPALPSPAAPAKAFVQPLAEPSDERSAPDRATASPAPPPAPADHATASANAPTRQLSASEIAVMMKRGAEFMANLNVGAARKIYQAAAEAGDPAAAFALAETYDPLVIVRLGAKGGIVANVALANRWYETAKRLGSPAAPERLNQLARLPE